MATEATKHKYPQCGREWNEADLSGLTWREVYTDHKPHCRGKPPREPSFFVGTVGAR
ncbi:MAG: hypothetical protein LC623_00540 [Halobacteriales archaeon]|nr:hypothetical protein [Halobacteriales archaeon]